MENQELHPQSRERNARHQPANKDRGLSRERLARLHVVLRSYVESGYLPGLVALVYHRGHVHVDAIGTFAFGSHAPMRRDTIFRLASMTKPITAVGAMILVEECKLRLDDPVDEWLPELRDRRVLRTIESPLDETVPARRAITVRDLLTLRSGYGELGFLAPTSPLQKAMIEAGVTLNSWPFDCTPDGFMQRLSRLPLAHQPGERWLYHTGCEILGVLIARVTGKRLGEFLNDRIFEPLGMKDTGFHVPDSKLDRLPACYGTCFPNPEVIVLDDVRSRKAAHLPLFESGGGGLVSTVDDMLAFGRMMMDDGSYGRERILSRPSVELMTMDHLTPFQKAASPFFENFWETRGWGFGMSVITKRCDLSDGPGRFGWDGAFGTSWHVDPKEGLIGVLMTQRRPDLLRFSTLTQDFWNSVYQLIDD